MPPACPPRSEARRAGLIEPVLVGPQVRLEAVATEAGLDLTDVAIVDVRTATPLRSKLSPWQPQVKSSPDEGLHTDELMSALVSAARLPSAPGQPLLPVARHLPVRPFIVTDAAINIAPTLEQKADIIHAPSSWRR